jgi:hypothetical protein
MMFELLRSAPGWAWVLIAWCLASVCTAAGLARWFQYVRDDYMRDDKDPWSNR